MRLFTMTRSLACFVFIPDYVYYPDSFVRDLPA